MRVAYFDCFSGASGDMILGALLHAGLDASALERELRKLPLEDWHLHVETVYRHRVAATRVEFHDPHHRPVDDPHDSHHHDHSPHRHLDDILRAIQQSELKASVKANALRIFDRLAEAEGAVHRLPKESVHFHEVGALDAILDVVGACIGFHLLGVEAIYVSPMPVGRGFVRCAHGVMPVPVPGTMELLRGVPVVPTEVVGELVTPTGAAILTTLATGYGSMPEMRVTSIGYGAGKRDLVEHPNMLRVVLGEKTSSSSFLTDSVVLLETNLDDQSPETFGYLLEQLLNAGALDAFFTPVVMKKGRPAYTLSVLAEPTDAERLAALVLKETSTFGVRLFSATRRKLYREQVSVGTPFGEVRVKVGRGEGIFKIAPEYEDCRRCAESAGVPIRDVYEAVLIAYRSSAGNPGDSKNL